MNASDISPSVGNGTCIRDVQTDIVETMALHAQKFIALLLFAVTLGGGCVSWTARSVRALDEGALEDAVAYGERATEREEAPLPAWVALTDAYIATERWAHALDALERGLDTHPDAPELLNRLRTIALATDDDALWLAGWRARSQELPRLRSEEALIAASALGIALRRANFDEAEAIVTALQDMVERDSEPWQEVRSSLNLWIYQQYYVRNYAGVEEWITRLDNEFGEAFLADKHRVVLAFERRESGAADALEDLFDEDLERLEGLAFEFTTRGVYRSATAAYERLGELASSDSAPAAFRSAADAAYRAGLVRQARDLLQRAAVSGSRPAAELVYAYRTARTQADIEFASEFLLDAASTIQCDRTSIDDVLLLEETVAGALIESHPDNAAERIRERYLSRAQTCSSQFERAGAIYLGERGEIVAAVELLESVHQAAPDDAQVAQLLISTHESAGDIDAAQDVARAFIDTRMEGELTNVRVEEALGVLDGTRAPELQALRRSLLGELFERTPGNRALALRLASELHADGLVDDSMRVLDEFAASAEQEWQARLEAGVWLADHAPEDPRTFDWLADVGHRAPIDQEAIAPVGSANTVVQSAWMLAAEVALENDRRGDAVNSLIAFVERGGGQWADVWSQRQLIRRLPATGIRELANLSLAGGYENRTILSQLGIAMLDLDDPDGAQRVFVRAVEIQPASIESLVDELVGRGYASRAIPVLDAYMRMRGQDAYALRQSAEIFLQMADASSDDLQEAEYLALASARFRAFLEEGASLAEISVSRLDRAGLEDIAAEVMERSIRSAESAETRELQDIVALMVEAGRPYEDLEPYLNEVLTRSDDDALEDVWTTMHFAGYWEPSLELARVWLVVGDRPARHVPEDVALVVMANLEAGRRDEAGTIVREELVEPARALLDPSLPLPTRFATVRERREFAGQLLVAASSLYREAGKWTQAADTAEEALEVISDDSVRSRLFEQALLARRRANGGVIARSDVEALVGLSGGSDRRWLEAGDALADAGDFAGALAMYDAVNAQSTQGWEASTRQASVLMLTGRAEDANTAALEALERVQTLSFADTAVLAIMADLEFAYGEVGMWDDFEALLSPIEVISGPNPILERTRIRLEMARAQVDRARRRYARLSDNQGQAQSNVEVAHEVGLHDEAFERWQLNARQLGPDVNSTLISSVGFDYLEREGYEPFLQLLNEALAFAPDYVTAPQLTFMATVAGQPGVAAGHLAPLEEELDAGYLYLLAGLQGAAGSFTTMRNTLARMTGPERQHATFPALFPESRILELFAHLDAPRQREAFLAEMERFQDERGYRSRLARVTIALGDGDDALAFDLVRELTDASGDAGGFDGVSGAANSRRAERLAALADGLLLTARAGFVAEALAIADQVVIEDPSAIGIEIAALRVVVEAQLDADIATRLAAVSRRVENSPELLRRVADALLAGPNAYAMFDVLGTPLGSLPIEDGSSLLSRLLSAAFQESDTELMDAILALWMQRRDQPPLLMGIAADELERLGEFEAAWRVRRQRYEYVGADDIESLRLARSAALAGDQQSAVEWMRELRAVSPEPANDLAIFSDAVATRLDTELAAELSAALVDLGPSDLDTLFWAADVLFYAGQSEQALELIGNAWERAAGHSFVGRAVLAALARWDLPEVPDLLDRMVAPPDVPWDLLIDAAELYALYGFVEEARLLVNRAIWSAPDVFEARQRAFGAARAAAAWGLAYDVATEAVVNSPTSGLPYLWRGLAKVGLGRCDEAHLDFETYLQSDITLIDGLPQIVHALAAAGCAEQAEPYATRLARLPAALATVVEFRSSPIVGLDLAMSSYIEADAPAGLEFVEEAAPDVIYYPERGGLVITTAQLQEEAGDWEAADQSYIRARASDPDDSMLLNNHAYVLAVQGEDLDRAEWMARHSIALDYEADPNTFDTLGWVYFQMGDHEQARRWLEAAARIAGHRTDPAGVRLLNVIDEHIDALPEPPPEDDAGEESGRRRNRRRRGE